MLVPALKGEVIGGLKGNILGGGVGSSPPLMPCPAKGFGGPSSPAPPLAPWSDGGEVA